MHIHSTFSDGTFTPSEIVRLAKEKNLSALALTDHNTVRGLGEFRSACEEAGILYSAGIEITTEFKGEEVHLVAHFLPEESYEEMSRYVEERNRKKEEANRECFRKLKEAGYPVDFEEFNRQFPILPRNRANIAAYLVSAGIVTTVKEAFQTLLVENGVFVSPVMKLPLLEAIEKVRSLHGVPVVAHPLLQFDSESIEEFIPIWKEHGLVGMETHYTLFDSEETEILETLAKKYGLLQSGGSDFHGKVKAGIQLGCGHGDLRVPFEFFELLREKSEEM